MNTESPLRLNCELVTISTTSLFSNIQSRGCWGNYMYEGLLHIVWKDESHIMRYCKFLEDCLAGVQNMLQHCSTAARHFFSCQTLLIFTQFTRFLHDFTRFYVIFTQFYMIFTRFYAFFAIFTRFFARHKFSAARHLKLFCTPAALTIKLLYFVTFLRSSFIDLAKVCKSATTAVLRFSAITWKLTCQVIAIVVGLPVHNLFN